MPRIVAKATLGMFLLALYIRGKRESNIVENKKSGIESSLSTKFHAVSACVPICAKVKAITSKRTPPMAPNITIDIGSLTA
jgi:hypothetical protein